MTGVDEAGAAREVAASVERLFDYGAWADKFEGVVHKTVQRHITVAMPEPMGVIGIACPTERPLLAFVSLVARSEEHTSELPSRGHLVCRLLLEKKNRHDSPSLQER